MFKLFSWPGRAAVVGLAAGVVLLVSVWPAIGGGEEAAGTAPPLGLAESFAVLAGSTVTIGAGPANIGGDIGVSPGTAITDQQNISFAKGGSVRDTADSLDAQNAVITANTALTGATCSGASDTQSLAGPQTISPGVYCYAAAVALSGTVTLSGDGVFIFKTGTEFTTATGSTVALTNGAQPCNVFWQIGSSADLFTSTTFVGSILADQSINLQNGVNVSPGRTLAKVGAVTMNTNTVHRPDACAAGTTPTTAPAASSTPGASSTPEATALPPGATETATPVIEVTQTPGNTTTPVIDVTGTPATTPTATNTPSSTPTGTGPTAIATPTNTPTLTPTAPTAATPTNTPPNTPTNTPTPTTTATLGTATATTPTATTPPVVGLPPTGGAPPQGGGFSWVQMLVASVAGSLGAIALGLSVRARRRAG